MRPLMGSCAEQTMMTLFKSSLLVAALASRLIGERVDTGSQIEVSYLRLTLRRGRENSFVLVGVDTNPCSYAVSSPSWDRVEMWKSTKTRTAHGKFNFPSKLWSSSFIPWAIGKHWKQLCFRKFKSATSFTCCLLDDTKKFQNSAKMETFPWKMIYFANY